MCPWIVNLLMCMGQMFVVSHFEVCNADLTYFFDLSICHLVVSDVGLL